MRFFRASVLPLLAALSCSARPPSPSSPPSTPPTSSALDAARGTITAAAILAPIRTLASDDFEGRAPGTAGEEKTMRYITDRFKALGVAPGNPDGTYVQAVPMIGFTSTPRASIAIAGKTIALAYPQDYVAGTRQVAPHVSVEGSDIVFVGYGVIAPELGWDDFKGLDARGKTLVFLIGDPQVPDPADPSKLDDAVFKGRALTYYGRWSYKYEIAASLGAAAAMIVHETAGAGYPFEVVQSSWAKENLDIAGGDGAPRVPVQSWIALGRAKELFAASGHDFDALKRAANGRDFRPVALGAKATFAIDTVLRPMESRNVIGRVEGSDPARKAETVIYSAHWDHLGRRSGGAASVDSIWNGAIDNASGVGTMLAIAGAFAKASPPPKRTIVFLSPTGEESGLLGAKLYASHPLYPLSQTVADINMDCMNVWGRTKSIVSIAQGMSTLDDLLAAAARAQGRTVKPDPEPEKGYFYRSDHFELAKKGVPSLHFLHPGDDYVGKPAGYGAAKRDAYVTGDYHKPSDDVKPYWDLEGAAEDARLLFDVGYALAQSSAFPTWREGTELKAVREETLKKR